jgi:hypothetical protein
VVTVTHIGSLVNPATPEPGWRRGRGRGRVWRDGSSLLMPHLVIVRRGRAGAYETLKSEFERDANSGVRVVWDRRQGERRETIDTVDRERRHRERRGMPPPVWTSLGIIVVAVETTDP